MIFILERQRRSKAWVRCVLCLGYHQAEIKVSAGNAVLPETWAFLPRSLFLHRIHFLVVLRLKFLFFCWFLAGDALGS